MSSNLVPEIWVVSEIGDLVPGPVRDVGIKLSWLPSNWGKRERLKLDCHWELEIWNSKFCQIAHRLIVLSLLAHVDVIPELRGFVWALNPVAWVQIPSTPSMLFSICIVEIVIDIWMRKVQKAKKRPWLAHIVRSVFRCSFPYFSIKQGRDLSEWPSNIGKTVSN